MTNTKRSIAWAVVSGIVAVACGGSPSAPPGPPTSDGAHDAGVRTSFTAAQCAAAGGEVVGDIGDGAIHRPGYRCARSGKAPLGPVVAEGGGPVAVEGSVCCP